MEQVAGEAPGWSSKTGKIERAAEPEPAAATPECRDAEGRQKSGPAELPRAVARPAGQQGPIRQRWLHEIKFDGYRLQARIEAGRVKLLTRSGLDWTAKFGKDIAAAFKALPVGSALIDGELVVENHHGASDFSLLQADLSEGRADRFVYYAFDLMHLDGYDLRATPLVMRKAGA